MNAPICKSLYQMLWQGSFYLTLRILQGKCNKIECQKNGNSQGHSNVGISGAGAHTLLATSPRFFSIKERN